VTCIVLLYFFQSQLIFHPGKLTTEFPFKTETGGEEVFLKTSDDETISGLFFRGTRKEVILYFHGNAGDMSGWQFVAEDFLPAGFGIMIIDYRGFGKSTGVISEKGFYHDADAAWQFLTVQKQVSASDIIIYGRSIGTGVAVQLAAKHPCKGLVLEAPYTSLARLAGEKLPMFFPSLILRFRFDNRSKINQVKCPVIFIHGKADTIIPSHHSDELFREFTGKKELITIQKGSHNDLNSYPEYQQFLEKNMEAMFGI
jgi:pimeloyl-ACP methyl ester carboxylesterase